MATYDESERLKNMAEGLIEEHHEHLAKTNIAYVMKSYDPESKSKGSKAARPGKKRTIGKARCLDAILQLITGIHFVIIIDERLWDQLEVNQQTAVLDHELSHLGWDADGAYLKDHDITEFGDVVSRHGIYMDDIQEFLEKTRQLPLFTEQADEQPAIQ